MPIDSLNVWTSSKNSCTILDEIQSQSHYFGKAYNYSKGYLPAFVNDFVGDFLRDRFYLPFNQLDTNADVTKDSIVNDRDFFIASKKYFEHFTKMFNKKIDQTDNTFSHFDRFQEYFDIRDIKIKINSGDIEYDFKVRLVQSKDFDNASSGVRFFLFSFYEHSETNNGEKKPWDPKSLEAIGLAPIEVLRALKENGIKVDSILCFSLGTLVLDAVKKVQEDILPNTIIIDRGLTSIKKVASAVLPWPLHPLVYNLAWLYGLDADPEAEFPHYLERYSEGFKNKKVVVIESLVDTYFSNERGYGPDYLQRLKSAGASVFHGKFFIPGMVQRAQHVARRDFMLNNPAAGTTTNITDSTKGSLADSLSDLFTSKGTHHTSFFVGGNKNNLDSMLYELAPILNSYISKN